MFCLSTSDPIITDWWDLQKLSWLKAAEVSPLTYLSTICKFFSHKAQWQQGSRFFFLTSETLHLPFNSATEPRSTGNHLHRVRNIGIKNLLKLIFQRRTCETCPPCSVPCPASVLLLWSSDNYAAAIVAIIIHPHLYQDSAKFKKKSSRSSNSIAPVVKFSVMMFGFMGQ